MERSSSLPPKPAATEVRKRPAALPDADWRDTLWPDDEPDPPVRPLTREEAQALSARHPSLQAWQVIGLQLLLGVLVALVWGGLADSRSALLSSLWGMAVVVVPGAVMALGIFGSVGGDSVARWVVWELIKIVCAGLMLALAPFLIQPLNWLAMLLTMVLCMKVIGVALFVQGRLTKKISKI